MRLSRASVAYAWVSPGEVSASDSPSVQAIGFPFSDAERARLCVYRTAIRAGFYSDALEHGHRV